MKHVYKAFLVAAMLVASSCAFAAEPPSREEVADLYPTLMETYEDCKAAVAIADKGDLKGFMRTRCAMQMNGAYSGFSTATGAMSRPGLYRPEDACFLEEEKLYKKFERIICFKKERLSKNTPFELDISRKFISYIKNNLDNGFDVPPHLLEQSPYMDIGLILIEMYPCEHIEGKK